MICEPRGGGRQVAVTEGRTAVDFAHQMRWLVEEAYPDAQVVRLVLDNSTPTSSARSTKHLSQAKLDASPNASSFITLPRTAAG